MLFYKTLRLLIGNMSIKDKNASFADEKHFGGDYIFLLFG